MWVRSRKKRCFDAHRGESGTAAKHSSESAEMDYLLTVGHISLGAVTVYCDNGPGIKNPVALSRDFVFCHVCSDPAPG
jgi:hypothetical protein